MNNIDEIIRNKSCVFCYIMNNDNYKPSHMHPGIVIAHSEVHGTDITYMRSQIEKYIKRLQEALIKLEGADEKNESNSSET